MRANPNRQLTRQTRICYGTTQYVIVSLLILDYSLTSPQDVTCDEVCVFCCIRFDATQKFLRHVEDCHRKDKGRKADYLGTTCTELSAKVAHELHLARHSKPYSDPGSEGKRRRLDSDVGIGALDTGRAKKVCTMNNGQPIATSTFMQTPTGGEPGSVDMHGAVGMHGTVDMHRVDMNGRMLMDSVGNGFDQVSSGLFYSNQADGLGGFDFAPILHMISAPAAPEHR